MVHIQPEKVVLLSNLYLTIVNHVDQDVVIIESLLILIDKRRHDVCSITQVKQVTLLIWVVLWFSDADDHQYAVCTWRNLLDHNFLEEWLLYFDELLDQPPWKVVDYIEECQTLYIEILFIARQFPYHYSVCIFCPVNIKLGGRHSRSQIVLQDPVDLLGSYSSFIVTDFTLNYDLLNWADLTLQLTSSNVTEASAFPLFGSFKAANLVDCLDSSISAFKHACILFSLLDTFGWEFTSELRFHDLLSEIHIL